MAQWRKVTMREAIRFIRDGDGQPLDERPRWADDAGEPDTPKGSPGIEYFSDGTAIACASDWSGPYSEVTPDVDAHCPDWFIYC